MIKSWDSMNSVPDLGQNMFSHFNINTKISRKQIECIFEKNVSSENCRVKKGLSDELLKF